NCSSVDPSTYTLHIFAGSLVFVMSVWLILMGVGIFLDGRFFHGRAWAAVLNSLIFAFIATAISVFVSTFCPGDNLLNLIIQAVGLGMSFFCGIFVPQSVLSERVVSASRFLPAYWYIRANEMLCGKVTYDFGDVATCLLIEAGFAIAIIALTVLVRKVRYSSSSILTAVKA
ncbi:MAG: ABC transporter permease, partial [Ruminococcus sp.]|nr:ABC transporter permease [Ruminococcus sp.]